jgi:hypothetical protein
LSKPFHAKDRHSALHDGYSARRRSARRDCPQHHRQRPDGAIDTTTAEKAPGVLAVFTYRNMPRMNPTPKPWSHLHPHLPLQDEKIHYAGQPIALVNASCHVRPSFGPETCAIDQRVSDHLISQIPGEDVPAQLATFEFGIR